MMSILYQKQQHAYGSLLFVSEISILKTHPGLREQQSVNSMEFFKSLRKICIKLDKKEVSYLVTTRTYNEKINDVQ